MIWVPVTRTLMRVAGNRGRRYIKTQYFRKPPPRRFMTRRGWRMYHTNPYTGEIRKRYNIASYYGSYGGHYGKKAMPYWTTYKFENRRANRNRYKYRTYY